MAPPDTKPQSACAPIKTRTITTPKGDTYLRPADHQGLSEMYIAEAWTDDRAGSETEGFIIARLVETLHRDVVAPPEVANYTPLPFVLDPLIIPIAAGAGVVVIVLIAIVWFKKK